MCAVSEGVREHTRTWHSSLTHENEIELHHCMQLCEEYDERIDTINGYDYDFDNDIREELDCLGISYVNYECTIHYYVPADNPDGMITTARNHQYETSNLAGCYAMDDIQWPTLIPSTIPSVTRKLIFRNFLLFSFSNSNVS